MTLGGSRVWWLRIGPSAIVTQQMLPNVHYLIQSSHQPYEVGPVIMLTLQMSNIMQLLSFGVWT